MTGAENLSATVAGVAAVLVVLGAALALIGSFGLLRLPTFYERVHPPTMGTTLGIAFTLVASAVLFSALESRPVLHEILIAVFAIVTTPVTYLLLLRAAIRRESTKPEDHGARVLPDRDSRLATDDNVEDARFKPLRRDRTRARPKNPP